MSQVFTSLTQSNLGLISIVVVEVEEVRVVVRTNGFSLELVSSTEQSDTVSVLL